MIVNQCHLFLVQMLVSTLALERQKQDNPQKIGLVLQVDDLFHYLFDIKYTVGFILIKLLNFLYGNQLVPLVNRSYTCVVHRTLSTEHLCR